MGDSARRPVRVAIVDSGVNAEHPHVAGRGEVVFGPAIGSGGVLGSHDQDRLGHGTAVAAAVLDLAPGSVVVSVRVFDDRFECPFEHVLHAIEVALEHNPDVINLSLGTTFPEYLTDLDRLVRSACARGVRVVAPASAGGLPSYPGSLEGTDSVVVDPNLRRNAPQRREVNGRSYWFASPHPRSIADVPRESNWSGVSFAVANVSGFLASSPRD